MATGGRRGAGPVPTTAHHEPVQAGPLTPAAAPAAAAAAAAGLAAGLQPAVTWPPPGGKQQLPAADMCLGWVSSGGAGGAAAAAGADLGWLPDCPDAGLAPLADGDLPPLPPPGPLRHPTLPQQQWDMYWDVVDEQCSSVASAGTEVPAGLRAALGAASFTSVTGPAPDLTLPGKQEAGGAEGDTDALLDQAAPGEDAQALAADGPGASAPAPPGEEDREAGDLLLQHTPSPGQHEVLQLLQRALPPLDEDRADATGLPPPAAAVPARRAGGGGAAAPGGDEPEGAQEGIPVGRNGSGSTPRRANPFRQLTPNSAVLEAFLNSPSLREQMASRPSGDRLLEMSSQLSGLSLDLAGMATAGDSLGIVSSLRAAGSTGDVAAGVTGDIDGVVGLEDVSLLGVDPTWSEMLDDVLRTASSSSLPDNMRTNSVT